MKLTVHELRVILECLGSARERITVKRSRTTADEHRYRELTRILIRVDYQMVEATKKGYHLPCPKCKVPRYCDGTCTKCNKKAPRS